MFEPNAGQIDPPVRFVTHSRGMAIVFADNKAVMVLHKRERSDPNGLRGQEGHPKTATAVVRMKLGGAGTPGQTAGLEKLAGIRQSLEQAGERIIQLYTSWGKPD